MVNDDEYMGNIWVIYGNYIYIYIYGSYMGNIWELYIYMVHIWVIYGNYMVHIWVIYGNYMIHMGNIWRFPSSWGTPLSLDGLLKIRHRNG